MTLDQFLADEKLSPAEFGRWIGRSRAAMSRYLNGQRVPDKKTMDLIREATGGKVTADSFYAQEEAA